MKSFYHEMIIIERKSSGSTLFIVNFSQYDSFIFDLSINPFPPADWSDFYHEEFSDELAHIMSPPEYDCFYFKNEPELGNFTMDVVEDIFDNPTREPKDLTLYVVSFPSGTRNRIFDPGIFIEVHPEFFYHSNENFLFSLLA
ncbi:hypothetical protein Tco_0092022 [Tanacetum coccineum]